MTTNAVVADEHDRLLVNSRHIEALGSARAKDRDAVRPIGVAPIEPSAGAQLSPDGFQKPRTAPDRH